MMTAQTFNSSVCGPTRLVQIALTNGFVQVTALVPGTPQPSVSAVTTN
jgi:hypothetical protein